MRFPVRLDYQRLPHSHPCLLLLIPQALDHREEILINPIAIATHQDLGTEGPLRRTRTVALPVALQKTVRNSGSERP
jgi:hypothetical protein